MNTYEYNGHTRWVWMMDAAQAIQRVYYTHQSQNHHRSWHVREQQRYNLHPVIQKAVLAAPPADWHQLVLEWPHVSVSSDTSKIAYTRNEQHGMDDRQTATTVGKYITRHFPTLRDHEVRDLCGMYGASTFCITHDMEKMIDLLQRGPKSCMVFDDNDSDDRCNEGHPYRVYAPGLGWGLAVRMIGNSVDGRALVNENDKSFVRSYRRNENGYSGADEDLQSWLNDQGYSHRCGWREGTRLKYIPMRKYGEDIPLAPFIDGNSKHVSVDHGNGTLVIDDDGEWECDQTNGEASEIERCRCDNCDDRTHPDDLYTTYDGDGSQVCEHCLSHEYVHAYGRRGYQYYVEEGDAVEVNGEWYHIAHLSDNNIVELYNGDYEDMDNAVCVDGDWYHGDDEAVVYCDDIEDYALRDECWQCAVTNNWYADEALMVRFCCIDTQDEMTVHRDEIDNYEADIESPDALEWFDVTTTIKGA